MFELHSIKFVWIAWIKVSVSKNVATKPKVYLYIKFDLLNGKRVNSQLIGKVFNCLFNCLLFDSKSKV